MSKRVSFKLHGQQLEAALKFARDANMDLNLLVEQTFFWGMRQIYAIHAETEKRAAEQRETAEKLAALKREHLTPEREAYLDAEAAKALGPVSNAVGGIEHVQSGGSEVFNPGTGSTESASKDVASSSLAEPAESSNTGG